MCNYRHHSKNNLVTSSCMAWLWMTTLCSNEAMTMLSSTKLHMQTSPLFSLCFTFLMFKSCITYSRCCNKADHLTLRGHSPLNALETHEQVSTTFRNLCIICIIRATQYFCIITQQ